jgi:type IV secretory pathway VirB10-like protein
MTNAGMFFAGVATTILLIGAGFGGGLLLARNAMEPMAVASGPAAADRLPPARVVLPASAAAAEQPPPSAAVPSPAEETSPGLIQTKEVQQSPERDRAAGRRKADEQERRKRVAERKAKREAARIATKQQPQQAPGIMAFGRDDEPARAAGFFGN